MRYGPSLRRRLPGIRQHGRLEASHEGAPGTQRFGGWQPGCRRTAAEARPRLPSQRDASRGGRDLGGVGVRALLRALAPAYRGQPEDCSGDERDQEHRSEREHGAPPPRRQLAQEETRELEQARNWVVAVGRR